MKIKPSAKFWDVRFTVPSVRRIEQGDGSVSEYQYRENVHVMAAAQSAAKVVELVEAEYPDATIHQIVHRGGSCRIIVQPDLVG